MKLPFIAAGLLAIAGVAHAQDRPVLTVMTYDSFVADWGPVPQSKRTSKKPATVISNLSAQVTVRPCSHVSCSKASERMST